MSNEIYVSTDIEADGPIPGENSMLSFGSAAFNENKNLIDTFSANLFPLPNAKQNEDTMRWWKTQPKAWQECNRNQEESANVLPAYVHWLRNLPGKPVFVGYPAGFDFMFIYWYLIKFTGVSPFSFSALDIKSYAMSTLNISWHQSTKRNYPKEWFDENNHSHVALEDAIEQGKLFCNILNYNKEKNNE